MKESGDIKPCIAAELLQDCTSEELDDVKAVCGSSYAGGADTVSPPFSQNSLTSIWRVLDSTECPLCTNVFLRYGQ